MSTPDAEPSFGNDNEATRCSNSQGTGSESFARTTQSGKHTKHHLMPGDANVKRVYEQHISEFRMRYSERCALIKSGLYEIHKKVKEKLTSEGVMYQETWRIKDEEAAVKTLERRQTQRWNRTRLKLELEKLDKNWTEYWTDNEVPERIDDHGPFQDADAMFKGLHDIGGIRIMVYFPDDVRKVVHYLKELDDVEFVREVHRGRDIAPDMFWLERYIEFLRDGKAPKRADQAAKPFPGYRATHIHVRPANETRYVVEIQIQTMVMNAWSQVEHDIGYKPGMNTSEEKKSILDTINGIVTVGENALKQLGKVLAQEEMQEAKHIYDIGKWIADHEALVGKNTHHDDFQYWKYLGKLFEYLKIDKQHTRGVIKELVSQAVDQNANANALGIHLPLLMLRAKCISNASINSMQVMDDLPAKMQTRNAARTLALRVIHCLNAAASLGIDELFIDIMNEYVLPKVSQRPTLLDFLEILHPDRSRVDFRALDSLCDFCTDFLDPDKFRQGAEEHLPSENPSESTFAAVVTELPRLIVDTGRIAYPIFCEDEDQVTENRHGPEKRMIIPRILCSLLQDRNNSHWIPDISNVAKTWSQGIVSARTKITSTAAVDIFQPDRHGKWNKLSPFKFFLDMNPTRWEFKRSTGEHRFEAEFRALKNASSPKKQPGFFISIRSGVHEKPRWDYLPEVPERWELRQQFSPVQASERGVEQFLRENPFADLMLSLLPKDASIDEGWDENQDSLFYAMSLNGERFTLQSTVKEFILGKHNTLRKRSVRAGSYSSSDASLQKEILRSPPQESLQPFQNENSSQSQTSQLRPEDTPTACGEHALQEASPQERHLNGEDKQESGHEIQEASRAHPLKRKFSWNDSVRKRRAPGHG